MLQEWLAALWSGTEFRQQRQRIFRYVDCTWESPWGEERSRISSLSPTGCYIQERFSVPKTGEVIRELAVALPGGAVNVQGIVTDATRGVGFAVRFVRVDPDARNRLIAFVRSAAS